ncbi:MAG: hypothetical protein ISQ19_00560 [PS1 clade bacterium]|uniref:Uncharacterized protein n=1 Tax=PS1 clade bacterium TaxID=2175152 RepID=A0A937HGI8_9PROT|nr:hypothetical protein [PS1 clade bacterium]
MRGDKLFAPQEDQNAFTDILFNALLGFAFMFSVAFILIRPEVTDGKINPKAEFMITAQWPDGHEDDIDLIVEDGEGNLVWFDAREAGLMHLDRDDRGWLGDSITVAGKRIENPLNQETVTIRGIAAGEYVVNLLHYKAQTGQPVPVKVKVEKLNPQVKVVFAGTNELTGAGDEQTAIRFRLSPTGEVLEMATRDKLLIRAEDFDAKQAGDNK